MDIVFHGLLGAFRRGLKQGTQIHIKTQICKTGGNNFGTTVVTILSQFGHQDAWTAAVLIGKGSNGGESFFKMDILDHLLCIHPLDAEGLGGVPPKNIFQSA